MSSGLNIVTSSFEQGVKEAKRLVEVNTLLFGRSVAGEFEHTAKQNAPWTDRTGNARRNLYGTAQTVSQSEVRVDMGGYAPNYKKSSSYRDYMELLEFGYNDTKVERKDMSIIYPTYKDICEDVKQQYGDSVLRSGAKFKITRSKTAMKRRYWSYNARKYK